MRLCEHGAPVGRKHLSSELESHKPVAASAPQPWDFLGRVVDVESPHAIALVFVAIILLKGLLVFGVVPWFVGSGADYQGALFPDNYDLIAENLVAGHGYRIYEDTSLTVLRTPGYVLVLAAIFAVFSKSLLAVQIVNFLMACATAWVVYLLVREMGGSVRWRIVASAISLLHPAMLMAETRGGLESALSLSLLLLVYMSCRAVIRGGWANYALAGIAFGACLLIKSSTALVLPAIGAWAILFGPNSQPMIARLVGFTIACLVGALVLSPWVLRNYVVTGKVIPTMTVGGLAAFQGLYVVEHHSSGLSHAEMLNGAALEQDEIARDRGRPYRAAFFPQFYAVHDEIEYYADLGRRVRERMIESPTLALNAVVHNSWAFWIQGRSSRATGMNAIITVPFILLAACGLWLARRSRAPMGILVVAILAFYLPHLPILAMARYHVPLIPLLAIPVAFAIVRAMEVRFAPSARMVTSANDGRTA